MSELRGMSTVYMKGKGLRNHDIIDRSNEIEKKRKEILTLLQLEVKENAVAIATTGAEQTELIQAFAHQQAVVTADTNRSEL